MFNAKEEKPLSPTEAAKLEVNRLFNQEREFSARRREKLTALAAIETTAGESILAGSSIGGAANDLLQAQVEIRAIEHAIRVARQHRLAAIRKRFETEAGELRATARAKRTEAAGILRQAEPLLKKLSELEGVQYTPAILLAERVGTWEPHLFLNPSKPIEDCNPFEAQYELGAGPRFAVPRTLVLHDEARALEKQAAELDSREIHQTGSISRASVEELLAAEELQNPEAVAPAASAVEDWAGSLERRVEKERPSLLTGNRQYLLTWRGGEIDVEGSSLSFPGVNYSLHDPTFTAA